MKNHDKILEEWYCNVVLKADKHLSKANEFEINSNKSIHHISYANGLYMALSMLSRIEKKNSTIKGE